MAHFSAWDSLCIETVYLVKRGSAQQDKGPLLALLAVDYAFVLRISFANLARTKHCSYFFGAICKSTYHLRENFF